MKISINTKFLAMSILLILITALGTSATYYMLTRQSTQRESQQRIRIAFEIVLDDITTRLRASSTRFDEFLQEDTNLRLAIHSYNNNTQWIGEKRFISRYLKRGADDMKKFGHVVSANRLLLYAQDTRLLVLHQQDDDQAITGGYVVSETGNNTYLPLDDSPESNEILFNDNTGIPDGAPLPSGISTQYEGDMPDTPMAELFREGQTLGIRITAPIYRNEEKIGVLVGETHLSQDNVERYATLSKTAINLFAGNQLSIGTLDAQEQIEPDVIEQSRPCDELLETDIPTFSVTLNDQEYYQGRCVLHTAQGESVGMIAVNLSQEIEYAETRRILVTVLVVAAIATGIAFTFSLVVSRKTIHAIHNIVEVMGVVSEGDLRPTAIVGTHDEIGMLAIKLNQMIAKLRTISGQIQHTSHTVNSSADSILGQMETLVQHMQGQSNSVDQATGAVEEIKQFIDMVAQNTNDLLSATAQVLASTQETRASIAEVTTSTGALTGNLHQISSSVDQVDQSVRRISGHTGQLVDIAQQTDTEIQQIDRSFQEVSQNAAQTQQLASETMEAALSGQTSVDTSLQGITDLKAFAANTAQIIQEINAWGERVSAILGMVDDITEQTSLLALNASIISAQAGSHGRGFAVVAEEIKDLAIRTKSSTKEIGTLIHELQTKTEEGVKQTTEGIAKAEHGVHLAHAVKEALSIILESATRTSRGAADTVKVIQQTTESSQTIRTSMQQVTQMVSQIRTALQEQEQDMTQVIEAVENISGMSEQVNRASLEQKHAATQIADSMGHVTERFSDISEQTETLQQHADHIVTAMQTMNSTTDEILRNTSDISGETVKDLLQQSDLLQKIVNIFKIS